MNIQPKFQSFFEHDVAVVQLAQVQPGRPASKENNGIEGLIYTSIPIALSIFGLIRPLAKVAAGVL